METKKENSPLWSNDPIVPSEGLEADVEPLFAALIARVDGTVYGPPPHSFGCVGIHVDDQERSVGVRPLVPLRVEDVDVPVGAAAAVYEETQLLLAGLGQPGANGVGEVDLLPAAVGLVQGYGDRVCGYAVELLERKTSVNIKVQLETFVFSFE